MVVVVAAEWPSSHLLPPHTFRHPLLHHHRSLHNSDIACIPPETCYNVHLERHSPKHWRSIDKRPKRTTDIHYHLEYCLYLIESAAQITDNPDSLGLDFTLGDVEVGESVVQQRKTEMIASLEAETLKWLKRLASGGRAHPEAIFLLGEAYGKGRFGLEVDHSKAFALYIQATKAGHPVASYRVAVCHEVGAGTKRDCRRAVQFYRKAAALGHTLAMHKVGLILLYGKLGHPKNLKEGISWLKRAAANATQDHPDALHDLAQCYEKNGGCPVVIPDERYAFELYSQAATFGYAPSQYRLGTFFEFGIYGCKVDSAQSIKWYSKAAEKGYADAELALSGWYLSGADGYLRQNDNNAYLWARKAADRGHARAEFAVGHYFEVGIGVATDLEEARRWYELSAGKGYKRAVQRLAELKKSQKSGGSGGKKIQCVIC